MSDQHQVVLQAILESPKGIVIFALDRAYRYLAFNENHARTIEQIWGVTLHVGDCMLDVIGRDDDRTKARRNFDRVLAGESFTVIEEYGDEKYNRRYYENAYSPIIEGKGSVIGLTVYLTDITEKRSAELELLSYRTQLEELVRQRSSELEAAHAQLLHMQKLESVGLLAGGIAHDFNNLLAVMLGRTELAKGQLPRGHAAQAHLDIVQDTALEARMLTRQLLGYAGRGKFLVQTLTLSDVVQSMAQLLRASVSKSISLSFELSSKALPVEVDVTQIRQVILNLVVNAAEAIGEGPGRVVVRTKEAVLDEETRLRGSVKSSLQLGPCACIEVEDSGCGMDERVRARLFDPFFTTKFSGRGLGLAAVLGIVSAHQGTIVVSSEVGRGTGFSVLLPLAEGVAQTMTKSAAPAPLRIVADGMILVVDDEEPVRVVTSEVLRSVGFQVITAASGIEACELFQAHGNEVKLVLLDLTMPKMSGEETLRRLAEIQPDVRVVVMTGYTKDEVSLHFSHGELAGFLTKPFVREELVNTIYQALRLPESNKKSLLRL